MTKARIALPLPRPPPRNGICHKRSADCLANRHEYPKLPDRNIETSHSLDIDPSLPGAGQAQHSEVVGCAEEPLFLGFIGHSPADEMLAVETDHMGNGTGLEGPAVVA